MKKKDETRFSPLHPSSFRLHPYNSPVPHRLAILGSTGSIGCNALEVIEHLGPPYRATVLSGHANAKKLVEQTHRHRPAAVAVTDEATAREVGPDLRRLGASVVSGPDALAEVCARQDVDAVLSAVVGAAGLPAALSTLRSGKPLLLANKEALVVAGSLLIPEAKRRGAPILPVDSEHSAIFQAMRCGRREEVKRAILTASGGPFRGKSAAEIERATPADALKHPTWTMGAKITIDSATMFNKALELIEACWLFDLPESMIDVVVHPESVVHSFVEFVDGSTMAQLSPPDMRTPIQYAMTYPERAAGRSRAMDFSSRFALHFEPPDVSTFPALELGRRAAAAGGTAGAILNAANEEAVAAFLAGRVRFGRIARTVAATMDRCGVKSSVGTSSAEGQPPPDLDDLMGADALARRTARDLMASAE